MIISIVIRLSLVAIACIAFFPAIAMADTHASIGAAGTKAERPARSSGASGGDSIKLEEVIVTAQKREERLQDVPAPVTVLSASKLIEENTIHVKEYYNRVPGLNFATGTRGEYFLSMRGLTTGWYGNPTVGILVDDVPIGSSTAISGGSLDIDPDELASVEVLRGPQGTLYGVSSLGGVIKYVTRDPSTDEVSGSVRVGLNSVYHGDQPGYEARGAINLPLSNTIAVRGGAYSRRDAGFIDNIQKFNTAVIQEGINEVNAYGGRLASLWTPHEGLSLKLAGLFQHEKNDGSPYSILGAGYRDLQHSELVRTGESERTSKVLNATLKAKIGNVDLIGISGYGYAKITGSLDFSIFNSILPAGLTGSANFGVPGLRYTESNVSDKFSQEVRVYAPLWEHIDLMVGGFYTKETFKFGPNRTLAQDAVVGNSVGVWGTVDSKSSYEEAALFSDLTFKISERFDVQVGGRYSHDTAKNLHSITSGFQAQAFNGVDPFILPPVEATSNPVTYLLTPRFKVSQDLMVYARAASGFRSGGPNLVSAAQFGIPDTFAPDKSQNYEIGMKGDFLANKLMLDFSVYYIDWKNVQLGVFFTGGGYVANTGGAISQGAELTFQVRPWNRTSVAGWYAYTDAKLAQDFPANSQAIGRKGDSLPFSSRHSANLSIDHELYTRGDMRLSVGTTVVYVGDRKDVFLSTFDIGTNRFELPSYTQVDARASLSFGSSWKTDFYVKNATDERGSLQGNAADVARGSPVGVIYIQPRTVGVSLNKRF